MPEPTQPTRPSAETRDAEHADAQAKHESDRAPTPEEEAVAEVQEVDPDVAEHEEEMLKRGASQQGEGRLPYLCALSSRTSGRDPRPLEMTHA